jgi:hypothetical protein
MGRFAIRAVRLREARKVRSFTNSEDFRMHVSTMVRRWSALLVVLATASACSDAPIAPRAAQRPAFDIDALQPLASRSGVGNQATEDTVATLTIDPNVSRTYAFGQNWIYFPARAVCDPATSGYGPTLWDSPCTPLDRPITVTVHWSARGGHAFAEFSPELRFVPADDRSVFRWVILSLHDHRRIQDVDPYNILYQGTAGWVDESLTDPTLRAWIDPLRNSVVRRVKHFSGYLVSGGVNSGMGGIVDASY